MLRVIVSNLVKHVVCILIFHVLGSVVNGGQDCGKSIAVLGSSLRRAGHRCLQGRQR